VKRLLAATSSSPRENLAVLTAAAGLAAGQGEHGQQQPAQASIPQLFLIYLTKVQLHPQIHFS